MTLGVRTANRDDAEAIWRWRNDPATRDASLAQGEIPLGAHLGWFNAALEDPTRHFLIGRNEGRDIGFVRLDRAGPSATVSIALAPEARGRRLAAPFLEAAISACPWPVRRFTAVVRPENTASRALFERCDFNLKGTGNPTEYERENLGAPLIVVLANEIAEDGTPNDQSAARLALAAQLMAASSEARLVTSGWPYARDPATPISTLMARAAEKLGVDPARIIESPRARDTVGDAVFLAQDVIGAGPAPAQVTVVTSAYHAPRAQQIFRFVLGDTAPVTRAATHEPVPSDLARAQAASLAAFHATFEGIEAGDLPAILERLMVHHPLYNGEIHGPDSLGVIR